MSPPPSPTAAPPGIAAQSNAWLRRLPVWVVYLAGVLPGLWLFWRAFSGGLGPDPVKPLEHGIGLHALQFLLAALLVTPVQRLTRISFLRFRRALGLLGFFYALTHLLVWLLLDIQLRWAEILRDLLARPYVTVGMAALVLLVPLAWTSRDAALRRLGPRVWRRLHLLAYPATLLAALHFALVQKTWQTEPLLYLALAGALMLARLARGPL